jgi:NADH dehydrogenase FAD-containing subunit
MALTRRRLLAGLGAGALLWQPTLRAATSKAKGKVVVVGGGWGGLAAAAELRRLARALDVTLLEPKASFFSLPLSNAWLAGLIDAGRLQRDYAPAAARHGYRYVRSEVIAIEREKRLVHSAGGLFDYDWLVLATGIRHDYRAWFGDDLAAARDADSRYGAAYRAADDIAALKRKIDDFAGGDLLMTIPPPPYRCAPAPYERASAIAHLFKQRRIKGRLIMLDPGPGILGFRQLFAERYRDQVTHIAHATVTTVDLAAKMVKTEFDSYRFDDAILMPPQQAHDLVWQAGLIGRDSSGQPTGWAAQDPLHLHALGDERVFLVGDVLGPVSPLYGYYTKTGHMAVQLGLIAAAEIAARASDAVPPVLLPDSICHVTSDFALPEGIRIEAAYRQRGDGVIVQTARQQRNPQPRGEDTAWLDETLAKIL